jgi:hypothetical protein
MLMTNPGAALDLMAGSGSVTRSPSGKTTFRFAILANAFDGLVDDPSQQREQDRQALGQWVGQQGICPSGYTVNPPTSTEGNMGPILLYEGQCS